MMSASEDYYVILGIRPGASVAEIRGAYIAQVKRWHPDHYLGNPMLFSIANERLQRINAAFAWLSSPERVVYEQARAASDARKKSAEQHAEPPRTESEPRTSTESGSAKSSTTPPPKRPTPPPKIVVVERDQSSSRTQWRSFAIAVALSLFIGTFLIVQFRPRSAGTATDAGTSRAQTAAPSTSKTPGRVGTTESGETAPPEAGWSRELLEHVAPTHASALYSRFPDHQPRTMAQAEDSAANPRDRGRLRSCSMVVYTGKIRIVPSSRRDILTTWLRELENAGGDFGSFALEVSVREGTRQLWLPVDSKLVSYLEEEVSPGDTVTIFTVYAGDVVENDESTALFVIDGFRANG